MKKLAILLLLTAPLCAQQVHPNISYNALLNAACTNANSACSQAAFVSSAVGPGQNPFAPGTYSTLDIPTANYNAVTVTVQGTYAGVTIAFDFSDPTGGAGNTYYQQVCARTDINVLETGETLPTNQTRAWNCPIWATSRFRVRATAYGSGSVNVWITLTEAAIDPSLVVAASPPVVPGSTDPCQDLSQQKSSFAVNITTATTTAIVPVSGTTSVYVCGWSLQTVTAATIQFEFGSGTACATSPTVLTGAYSGTANQIFNSPGADISLLKAPSGNGICIVSTGTTPSIQGFVTFVQQ